LRYVPANCIRLISWILATTAGGMVGWAIAVSLMPCTWGAGLVLSAFPVGFCVGLAQYLILGLHRGNWLALTMLGMNAWLFVVLMNWKGLLYMTSSQNVPSTVVSFVIGGALIGLLQGLALRKPSIVLIWMPANALGWGLGGYYGFRAGKLGVEILLPNYGYDGILMGFGDMLHIFVAGCVIVAVMGIVTAFPAMWLLNKIH
jgi:hypothetical protein